MAMLRQGFGVSLPRYRTPRLQTLLPRPPGLNPMRENRGTTMRRSVLGMSGMPTPSAGLQMPAPGLSISYPSMPPLQSQFGGIATQFGEIPGRRTGGPVYAGSPYVVGEQGPEVMVPQTSGVVHPYQQVQPVTQASAPAPGIGGGPIAQRAGSAIPGYATAQIPGLLAGAQQVNQLLQNPYSLPPGAEEGLRESAIRTGAGAESALRRAVTASGQMTGGAASGVAATGIGNVKMARAGLLNEANRTIEQMKASLGDERLRSIYLPYLSQMNDLYKAALAAKGKQKKSLLSKLGPLIQIAGMVMSVYPPTAAIGPAVAAGGAALSKRDQEAAG